MCCAASQVKKDFLGEGTIGGFQQRLGRVLVMPDWERGRAKGIASRGNSIDESTLTKKVFVWGGSTSSSLFIVERGGWRVNRIQIMILHHCKAVGESR